MKIKLFHWYDKLLSFMLTILGFSSSAGFTACMYGVEYGPDPDFYKLEVNPSALEFKHLAGETKELRITTDGNNKGYWHINISDGSYFYSVTPISGSGNGTIYVTTTTDNNSYTKEGTMYISGENNEITIPVRQKGKPTE